MLCCLFVITEKCSKKRLLTQFYVRNLLGWLGTRLAQITFPYLELA